MRLDKRRPGLAFGSSPLRGWLRQKILKGPRKKSQIAWVRSLLLLGMVWINMRAFDCRDPSPKFDWYWDKEDKDDKDDREFEHTRGAKLVSDDAQITNMANKTKEKDRAYMRLDKRRPGLAFGSPASRSCVAGRFQIFRFFQYVLSRVLYSQKYFFIFLYRRSIMIPT